ncbi:ABC transporter substrate-binding protein [Bradyrhizobium sp. U87765 SZCCT0131]|uniref:ABC transporter substrate-binding protein n=1 Tax=unclassified Bradyrhizobium TaxID=2631580 RepID=UPI001BA96404|nr:MULTISPECIES: ABC transporter substrate-binding protein [unclassified Bradyrhizobium]MBR1217707.1 ABC transporter substrate-binding protein [Bradyrhizobium sp. U87765 SZCCT0131]MBR1261347.1 ABC transporter substrate-binding protein [Bradyrhizobium sp. U87765 SZCCT0134]MBR1303205.1 ABC transporter substrate-binding protein [Bradyrhizobium sp. U87765 SZCCT0110]MBR1318811.1 ABC transporter substrate-binding protein [Bradyrhizobium sp. U87765 SZCCT0109]MBR1347136.1 ABC transporter substrate-bin
MKHLRTIAMAGAASLGFLALSGQAFAAGPTCAGGAIKVGAVSTVTGPADFSEVPKATAAAFDQLNAAGGINGCKIDYTISDDKADPQVAAQAARDLIDNKEVVAMVGSASLLECQVNGATYKRKNVMSVQGLGVDAACFNSPSIAPVNVGPFALSTAVSYYATRSLNTKKLCAFFIIIGGTQEAYKAALANWEKITSQKIHLLDLTLPYQGDLTPYVIKARDAGCDAVINNSVEPGVVQWVKTAEAQKITGINWLFLAPGYTEQVAKALADTNQPVYVGTEWEPYTETGSAANKDWIVAMNASKRPLTAFSQGGYLAAQVFTDVIKSIDGPVTRDSVTSALLKMKPAKYPLAGSPYIFGEDKTHSPMQSTKIMKLDHGAWKVLTPDWVVLPTM